MGIGNFSRCCAQISKIIIPAILHSRRTVHSKAPDLACKNASQKAIIHLSNILNHHKTKTKKYDHVSTGNDIFLPLKVTKTLGSCLLALRAGFLFFKNV